MMLGPLAISSPTPFSSGLSILTSKFGSGLPMEPFFCSNSFSTQITGEDWARLIDQPTVVSFLQGLQTPYDTTYLNIYSFAGAEIEKEKKYYIAESGEGISCYHEADCPYLSEENKQSSYSMEEAAKHGAYPCSECIH